MRATQVDRSTASAFGINVDRVYMGTFALGAALAALAGVLIVPITQAHYLMGGDPLLLSFIVVIIGGLGVLARHPDCRPGHRPVRWRDLDVLLADAGQDHRHAPGRHGPGLPPAGPVRSEGVTGRHEDLGPAPGAPRGAVCGAVPAARPITPPTLPGSWCWRSLPWATTSPSATPACSALAMRFSSPPGMYAAGLAAQLWADQRRPGPDRSASSAAGWWRRRVGLLALRTAGVSFMIVTLMFAQAGYLTILYFAPVTGGDEGFTIARRQPHHRRASTCPPTRPRYLAALALFAAGLAGQPRPRPLPLWPHHGGDARE